MSGETLMMIGRVFMVLFPVASVILLLLWRRASRRWRDALLRDYGEVIYYGNRLKQNTSHTERIFPDRSDQKDAPSSGTT